MPRFSFKRKFRDRRRFNIIVCRALLLAFLVWVISGFLLSAHNCDCSGKESQLCKRNSSHDIEAHDVAKLVENLINDNNFNTNFNYDSSHGGCVGAVDGDGVSGVDSDGVDGDGVSVINDSPLALLNEIILANDASEKGLQKRIENLINSTEISKNKNVRDIGVVDGTGTGFAPGGISMTYNSLELKKWYAAPIVNETIGKPGELGQPVEIPTEMKDLMKKKFEENQFNVLASDMMSLNRSLKDVRHDNCKTKLYPSKLPTTSVVIVFHNEAWTTLLRTVWSVINRSPRALLKQIILVDDASERDYLGKQLEDYVDTLPVHTLVIRTNMRSGLIRARLFGVEHVVGEVITFLDAHCECSEGWLEPLLERIVQNRRTVVCPIIDIINSKTFEYKTRNDVAWGGFDWKLDFKWYLVPHREMQRRNNDSTAPFRTPTMAGNIFSIDKEYFYEIGTFDDGLYIWGGENLEMSFRIWQCGGILEIIPCSRVGHVFRDQSPYTFPDGHTKTVQHNKRRVAEVWMDEWRDFYLAISSGAQKALMGDLSKRISLRERLKCKSFRWYLENIYPESIMPLDYYYLGEIRHAATKICFDTMERKHGENLGINYCHGMGGNQLFMYTKRLQIMSNDLCLDVSSVKGPVNMIRCHNMGGNQEWVYDAKNYLIRHKNTGNCLQLPSASNATTLLMRPCDYTKSQQWLMESKFKWQAN